MKKKTILASMLLMSISVISFAQGKNQGDSVLKNKHGHPILPKAGDIALGFNAVPVIDFFYNSLNYFGAGANNPNGSGTTVDYTSNMSNQITGKYFLDDKSAIRVRLGFNTLSGSITNRVQDAVAMYNALQSGSPNDIQTASTLRVDDKLKFNKSNVWVSGGYEMRRGYGRLQGFFGAELAVGCIKENTTTTYGNALSDLYESTYTTDFNSLATATFNPAIPGNTATRNLDTTYNSRWLIGIRAFIGVEYFFFPKISIGAEFGWGYAVEYEKGYTVKNEVYYNGQTGPVDVVQTTTPSSSTTMHGFSVDNNNSRPFAMSNLVGNTALSGGSGAIILLFHF